MKTLTSDAPSTIDLWEDNAGGLAIVCRETGTGFCGFERGQNVARLRVAGRDEVTFASDATPDNFADLGEGSLYDALPADEVEALYELEGEANADVRVATYQDGKVTVHARSIGASARWYLDGADIGDEQIEALRDEAAAAGDEKQVDLCEKALGGDVSARAACVRVILDARAQG